MIKQFIIIAVLLFNLPLLSQHPISLFDQEVNKIIHAEMDRYTSRLDPQDLKSVASGWFDVSYYKLNLTITTNPQYINGVVTIRGVCREPVSAILVFDLMNSMHVDSVKVEGMLYPFVQESASLNINLDFVWLAGQWLTIDIHYRGLPVSTGFGSFMFGAHGDVPWIWSLSEPYGARDWFPCKDHPSDKADSADIIVTCDSSFKVGSNGKLIAVINNGDGTKTHHWEERYPIASYLISVAITNYKQFSNWYKYGPNDSMEILNYVLPENLSSALENLPHTVGMLEIFSNLFGEYPFIKEKYGHADFGRGGAMEHQTMTSTTTYDENTIVHELAHQWFGNMITCRTWSDLWLNEGFAQYATALYLEKKYGSDAYWTYMRNEIGNALLAKGSIYMRDTTEVKNLFNRNLTYAKGAVVLHMLRRVLGDSLFFKSLYNYANHPDFKYKTATIRNFQSVCEQTGNKTLDYFFDQWIYGDGYPNYHYVWSVNKRPEDYLVAVELNQKVRVSTPSFFKMPIDIQLRSKNWDTTITVFNNSPHQIFYFTLTRNVESVHIDPDGWILKSVIQNVAYDFSLHQNYPNPFNSTTTIRYRIPKRTNVKLSVYDILGQEIKILVNNVKIMGDYEEIFDAQDLSSGIYVYRIITSQGQLINKMTVIR